MFSCCMVKYTDKLAKEICVRLIKGESLTSVCADPQMPALTTVMDWINNRKEFGDLYRRARLLQADTCFDSIIDLENPILLGEITPTAAKTVLDSRRWRLSRINPVKYSDKQQPEKTEPVEITVVNTVTYENQT